MEKVQPYELPLERARKINANFEEVSGGETTVVTWDTLEGKPEVIASGATQADARTVIGAGTSSLEIGTTATTAKAGNYTPAVGTTSAAGILQIGTAATQAAAGNHNHAIAADAASGLAAAANLQAAFNAMSARVKALEDAAV